MEVLTQRNLKKYKAIDYLIKNLSDNQKVLKTEFIAALNEGEVPEMGEITILLATKERRSLSKDKIIDVFSDILVKSKIIERIESIPKTPYEVLNVDFIIENSVFKARAGLEATESINALITDVDVGEESFE